MTFAVCADELAATGVADSPCRLFIRLSTSRTIDSIASVFMGYPLSKRHAQFLRVLPVTTYLVSLMCRMADFAWYLGRAIWSFRVGTGCGDSRLA